MRNEIKGGFTLIELLVVMAVIAILATVGLAVYPQAQKQARDQQRKSDMRQFQAAIESYANANNGNYPSLPNNNAASVLCTNSSIDLDGNGYIASCPDDPSDPAGATYGYNSDGTAGTPTATRYFLYAFFEAPSVDTWFVVCSNGKTGTVTTVPNGVTGGACPL